MLEILKYYFTASTRYNLQSPFLHQFIKSCIENDDQYYAFQKIRQWTGKKHTSETRGRIIHKMVNFIKPDQTIIIGNEFVLSWYAKLADTRKEVTFINLRDKIEEPEKHLTAVTDWPDIDIRNGKQLLSAIGNNHKTMLIIEDVNNYIIEVLKRWTQEELNNLVVFCLCKHKNERINTFWNDLLNSSGKGLFVDFYKSGIYFRLPELSSERITYIPYPLKPWKIGLFGK